VRDIGRIRIRPYPPNFNSTAAKIIDPSNGASTWALGSHKWVKNIGIFTKNAVINKKINFILYIEINIIINDKFLLRRVMLINKGKDASTVYMRR